MHVSKAVIQSSGVIFSGIFNLLVSDQRIHSAGTVEVFEKLKDLQ